MTTNLDLRAAGEDLLFFANAPTRVLELAGWLLDYPRTFNQLVACRFGSYTRNAGALSASERDWELDHAFMSVVYDLKQLEGRIRFYPNGPIELLNPESVALCIRICKRQYLGDDD